MVEKTVNQKRIHKIVKLNAYYKKQKKLAKRAITLYNMNEKLRNIGDAYE